MDFQVATIAK